MTHELCDARRRRPSARWRALVVLGTVAMSVPASQQAAGGGEWVARYSVRFVPGPAPRYDAEVSGVLRWEGSRGSRPEAADLGMAGGYPDGFGAFVRDFEAVVPTGTRAPARGYRAEVVAVAEGRFRLPVLADGRVGFRYRVALEHDPGAGLGFDETPHAFADGTLWTGRALFVTVESRDVEVRFEVPDGVRVSTSLTDLADGAHRAASSAVLRETYLLVGRHAERTIELPGTSFVLAVDGAAAPAAPAVERFEAQLRTMVEAATAAVGGPPPPRCLLAVTVATTEGGGAVYGSDAHVLVPGPPGASESASAAPWQRTLWHELFHLWNPTKLGFDSREMWFSEGFTDYYAHLLLARRGELSGRAFLAHVGEWATAYLGEVDAIGAAGAIGLREAGVLGAKNRTLIYQGGALAALCLDVSLRHASSGKRSLDDVMAALYRLNGEAGGNVSVEELPRLLRKLGDRSLEGFVERHVAGAEPLPLAAALALAGLRLTQRELSVPAMDAVVHLFCCSGMTVVAGGIEINRTSAGELQPGDLVVEVARRPLTDFGDLRRALADRVPGDEVAVVVERAGKRRQLALQLGGRGEQLPASRVREVALEPRPEADRRARAVRAALFGPDVK